MKWLIYGAYGYSGRLIALEAKKRGLTPVLAGRNLQQLQTVAAETQFEIRAFDLNDATTLDKNLHDIELVLHCAGPFSATSAPMLDACLRNRCHYLDITGEMDVFEHCHSAAIAQRAKAAGVVVCPGVGFDVIPTDCIAAALKKALPDASHLSLGFASKSGFSPGTAKTSVEGMAKGLHVRIAGKIQRVAPRSRMIDFGEGERLAAAIGWGDVSTAYHSTGITNVDVYIPASPSMVKKMRTMARLRWLIAIPFVQNYLKKQVGKRIKGPDEAARAKSPTLVWGEASNAKGEKRIARVKTANGYDVTISGSLAVVEFLAREGDHLAGSYTPSKLIGENLVSQLPGSGTIEISAT
ncbi:MAG: saccharopine dehydrogenase NADP-binding domain-containing protein [Oceanospirillaceae bacterium]|nr:saccharopine dehydrogenase NADP-binding domain-containing protein [Oceanospirillaceae bacterium]MCP5349591.1 saccharopine dehydrogenase NADP-binding domain-containing protein [Oceanospirillaceae bacterium]